MLNDKFKEVLAHEGPLSITTWTTEGANVTNTWNSYVRITNEGKLLIPAAGMTSTQADIAKNNQVKLTLGTKEVIGTIGPGAGFLVEGTGAFLDEGEDFDQMKASFPFLNRVLEITPLNVRQTI